MTWYFVVITFILSCFVLSWLSSSLIKSLVIIAKYLNWREFVISFFIIAFAASLPNLFVDFGAVFHGIPEMALGDIIGGNLVDLTLVLAVAVFFSRKGLSAKSEMVQKSAIFTTIIAILPLLLIFDENLSRTDGLILIFVFILYIWWLFSKKERFKQYYKNEPQEQIKGLKIFLLNLIKIIVLLILLLIASQAVVSSAQFFSKSLGISIALVGILIIGLGNSFPETYFSIISAREEKNWMVLGGLMGSVIISSTLVLGSIALVNPFEIKDFSLFFTARIFLIVASILSLLLIRSGRKITRKEGLILLFVYVVFLLVEIFIK